MTAFLALLRRDLLVARRNAGPLLVATLTQPILVILVFGNLLPRMELVVDGYGTIMLPGLMAITNSAGVGNQIINNMTLTVTNGK